MMRRRFRLPRQPLQPPATISRKQFPHCRLLRMPDDGAHRQRLAPAAFMGCRSRQQF